MPVLDTTVLIDAKRSPALVSRVADFLASVDEAIIVPMQVAVEYVSGLVNIGEGMRELRESFEVQVFDEESARIAAVLAAEARRRGAFPGWADAQIAAAALREGMILITRNPRHFREAFGLTVWDYGSDPEPLLDPASADAFAEARERAAAGLGRRSS